MPLPPHIFLMPKHADAEIYILQLLRLFENDERPDSLRVKEWEVYKKSLLVCSNTDIRGSALKVVKTHGALIETMDRVLGSLPDLPAQFEINSIEMELHKLSSCKEDNAIKY